MLRHACGFALANKGRDTRALFTAQLVAARTAESLQMIDLDRGSVAASNHAPDEKHNYCSDDCTDQTGSLVGAVPTQGLTKERGYECSHDPENGRQDEARRFVGAGMKKFCDNPCNKSDYDRPKDTHFVSYQLMTQ